MTAHQSHNPSTFECFDKDQDSVTGNVSGNNGDIIYHVEATCNGLQCPPYVTDKELNCVVCTK